MLELLIDLREHIAESIIQKIQPYTNNNATTKIATLPVGDYQINFNNEPILIIERKTIVDYASSIKDGRHREQKGRLVSSYPKSKIMYLIEGDLTQNNTSYKFNHVSKETIFSAIFNTILRDDIQVFHTSNTQETIEMLLYLFIKIQKKGLEFLEEKKDNYNENLIETAKITKGGNMTPEISFRMMLNCIPNVSNKISARITKYHNSMSSLLSYLTELETREEKIKYLSQLKLDDSENRIPTKTCENILLYLGL
jgi:ERCC4-type nuclease